MFGDYRDIEDEFLFVQKDVRYRGLYNVLIKDLNEYIIDILYIFLDIINLER